MIKGVSQMNNGVINQAISFEGSVQIEVQQHEYIINNFHTIQFKAGNSILEINLSQDNFNELGQKMFPQGLMPDSFSAKVDMLNQLLEEIDHIEDIENKGYYITKFWYDSKKDMVYFDCEEE
jgi:hypothetical protein